MELLASILYIGGFKGEKRCEILVFSSISLPSTWRLEKAKKKSNMHRSVQITKFKQIDKRQREGRDSGSGWLIVITPRSKTVGWQSKEVWWQRSGWVGEDSCIRNNVINYLSFCLWHLWVTYQLRYAVLFACREDIFLSDSYSHYRCGKPFTTVAHNSQTFLECKIAKSKIPLESSVLPHFSKSLYWP